VDQVHSQNSERILLFDVRVVEHPHMQDDIFGRQGGVDLEADAHPPVAFVPFLETLRRDGVGEGEEGRIRGR